MKKILTLTCLLIACRNFAQCPFPATLASTGGNCTGATLTVNTTSTLSKIIWKKDGGPVSTVNANTTTKIETVAGGNGYGSNANQLWNPWGLSVDVNGNIYIADEDNDRIQKWIPGATSGIKVAGGDPDPDVWNSFFGVYADDIGNVYVVDVFNNRIQKWAPGATAGVTVAGGNGAGPGADQLNDPACVLVDANGNIYIADAVNDRIQKWAPGATNGVTVAGGNGEGAASNQLDGPEGIFVDGNGNLYIVDSNNKRVQKWAPGATSGITVAGGNGYGFAANQFASPFGLSVDANGDIFVTDPEAERVQEWMPGATSGITVAGGNGEGTADNQFEGPMGVHVNADGSLLIVDAFNNRVQKWTFQSTINTTYIAATAGSYTATITDDAGCTMTTNAVVIDAIPSATITSTGNCLGATLTVNSSDNLNKIVWYNGSAPVKTSTGNSGPPDVVIVAGGNGAGYAADQFNQPVSTYVDGNGNIYVLDAVNSRVQKWAPGASSGVTIAGGNGPGPNANQFNEPTGMSIDGNGNIYISDKDNDRIQKWAPGATSGVTVAGGNGEGAGANQFNYPLCVYVDGNLNIYVADWRNNRVQKWAPGASSGVTVAGGNGAGAAANQLDGPVGVFVDGSGNVFVVDENNDRIQKWPPGASSGITVAGGNGKGPAANQLSYPSNVFVDGNGSIFIADQNNFRIQKWAPGATVGVTVAGGNGQGSAADQFGFPFGIFVDNDGYLYISDDVDNRVVKWPQQLPLDMSYKPTTPGVYTAVVTTSGGCPGTTNAVTIDPVLSPSVSIQASGAVICSGTPVTFTATPVNGGVAPVYQWQLNGFNVGNNSDTYINGSLINGAGISCIMTSNAACTVKPEASSAPVTITVNPVITSSVSIKASATSICTGATVTFTAVSVNGGVSPFYQWQVNGADVGNNSAIYTNATLTNGAEISCIMSGNAACATSPTASSNLIPITVSAVIVPTISITTSSGALCSGSPVIFTSVATNEGNQPSYQWQVNGVNAGANDPSYTDNHPADGDIISCIVKGHDGCISSAVSNSIPLTVHPTPVILPGQIFQTSNGQGVILNPIIDGNIVSYSWSPAKGLSNNEVRNPIADPAITTVYTLKVVSADNCEASGKITVKVFKEVSIPNAFTPNGDGRNDVFYVLGGPAGSIIKDLTIFGRWGQKIFQVHDVPPGDPTFGWNGYYNGSLVSPGTYVYMITVGFAGGKQEVFKGTIILVR